jgi:branched-subunit amino acid transport protein
MIVWVAVAISGACSYALRAVPFLMGARARLSDRTQLLLRHAGMGGVAALLTSSLGRIGRSDGPVTLSAAIVAVVLAGVLALRGRSMAVVLAGGAASFALVTGAIWVMS